MHVEGMLLSDHDRICHDRERQDGLYSALAYLLCKLLEECLLSLGTSIFMSAAVFFAVGLQGNWLLFWAAFYLTTCTGIGAVLQS